MDLGYTGYPALMGYVRGSRGFLEDQVMDEITGRTPPSHEPIHNYPRRVKTAVPTKIQGFFFNFFLHLLMSNDAPPCPARSSIRIASLLHDSRTDW